MSTGQGTLKHRVLGQCELVRTEGTVWIVRAEATGQLFRFDSTRRRELEPSAPPAPAPAGVHADEISAPAFGGDGDRRLRVAIESLRTGLPSTDAAIRKLAVVSKATEHRIGRFLNGVEEGGSAMVIRGAYGQGKSFTLSLVEERALAAGFLVARTEIDASENQLNKPHHVYRDLIRNLRIPGADGGPRGLARLTAELVHKTTSGTQTYIGRAQRAEKWLRKRIECEPLAWLLSDPRIADNKLLLGLLAAEPGVPVASARANHLKKGTPQDWPAFSAATQGDFASYILSGLGRLSRELGFKGLLVIFDEMEKWQDLNWAQQAQAGNLLGGLLWGATEPEGTRQKSKVPKGIEHSARAGGFPFSTRKRCHLGIVIAMTPRGEEGPEYGWRRFGPIDFLDLADFNLKSIREFLGMLGPVYATAYGIESPPPLDALAEDAVHRWRSSGAQTTRLAIQSVVAALDAWREG